MRADGNVFLSNGAETAQGAWAEYDVASGIIRMGGNVVLTQGDNAISGESLVIDAAGIRADYLETLEELRERYRKECLSVGADYVALDTSMPFDKALLEYLSQRKARF